MLSFAVLETSAVNPFEVMAAPVIDLINMMLFPLILLVSAIASIYCIFLGAKLARAVDPQAQQKAKETLKNAIIGFLLIFVLIAALKIGVVPLTEWMEVTIRSAGNT